MLLNKIKEFENKYNVNFNSLFASFEDGASRYKLCEDFNITELPLRKFIYSLGLEFPKNKRQASIDDFKYKLGLEKGENIDLVAELKKDLQSVYEANYKLNKSIILQRDNANTLRKQMRHSARVENTIDSIVEDLVHYLPDLDVTIPVLLPNTTTNTPREGLCVVLSDEHIGEVVKEEEVPNNVCNYEVIEKRILEVVRQTILYPKQSKTLSVFNLLDSIKGIIHGGVYNTEDGFTTSILKAVQIYTKVYTIFSKTYTNVNVYVTLDNHGRKEEKPVSHNKWDNFSVLIMKLVENTLKQNNIFNVHFKFTKHDYNEATINNANILAFHGDSLRSYRVSSEVEVAKAHDIGLQMFGKNFKHFITGHKHKAEICANQYGGVSIQNGGVIGNTSYGINNGFRNTEPSQTIFFVNTSGAIEDFKIVNLKDI